MHTAAFAKSNAYNYTNGDRAVITDSDGHGNADSCGYGYTYRDGYTYDSRYSDTDAHLRTGMHAWDVDAGCAGSDRSLRWVHGQRWHLRIRGRRLLLLAGW